MLYLVFLPKASSFVAPMHGVWFWTFWITNSLLADVYFQTWETLRPLGGLDRESRRERETQNKRGSSIEEKSQCPLTQC